MEKTVALIVGLGNPGEEYDYTRHNVGFRVVQAFAAQRCWDFQRKRALKGKLASAKWGEQKVLLLLPTTYMNLSGYSVRATCRFYQLEAKRLLVVSDDVTLPFGTLRYRPGGSAGGHNGLKDIEAQLGTQEYPRLRVGVDSPKNSDLSSYVLDRFNREEEAAIPALIDRADEWIAQWLDSSESERNVSQTIAVNKR
ncbi:MAG: aminoacyl-tRNA hydrolase [Chlamydiota bacterium]